MFKSNEKASNHIDTAAKQIQRNTLGNSQARGFQQQKFQQYGLTQSRSAKQINGSLSHSNNTHHHSALKLR